jgi:hypothetical protein
MTHTCFDDASLIKLAKEYNRTHDDGISIPSAFDDDSLSASKRDELRRSIWTKLRDGLERADELPCNEDFCVLYSPLGESINDKTIHEETFRPEKPSEWYGDSHTWLTNYDIEGVMRQYEKAYRDFVFYGPSPVDFDSKVGFDNTCVEASICSISLRKLYSSGKRRVGFVFNLDPHDRPGSHWTALFCDMNTCTIFYFDSNGVEPPKEIGVLMRRLRDQGNRLIIDGILPVNRASMSDDALQGHFNDLTRFKLNARRTSRKGQRGGLKELVERKYGIESGDIVHLSQPSRKGDGVIGGTGRRVKEVTDDGVVILESALPESVLSAYSEVQLIRGDFEESYNSTRFQYGNTECGMFSMYFLIQCILGHPIDEIIRNRITDNGVWKKRGEYFRPNIQHASRNSSDKESDDGVMGLFTGGKGKKTKRHSKSRRISRRIRLRRSSRRIKRQSSGKRRSLRRRK